MPSEIAERVYALLRKVPRGRVTTYSELARRAGTGPRAVGKIMNVNPYAPRVPCHRVVMSDGRLGGFAGRPDKKLAILAAEGVKVERNKVVDFDEKFFRFG